jgi:enoyl-CoA hydratase
VTASFGLLEIKVGVPSVIDAARLPAFVGLSKAREMVLTGDLISCRPAALPT